ncbi:MAG: transposase [Sedimentisphaerales bacterium]|nr:transposase [Sedimentisphaerales bacterium]
MGKNPTSIHEALQAFGAAVTAKMTQLTHGEPEDQVRGPFENFMGGVAAALGWNLVCTGETPLPGRLGRPDYAVHLNRLLAGYVELKAPGVGATATLFKGHNRDQFKRFSAIPNILYTDGNQWALYRDGKLVDKVVQLSGDVAAQGKKAVAPPDAHALERLLRDFFSWQPIIPTDRKGRIDLKGFAALLAPLTRMLRDDVTDALKDTASPLVQLAKDWRQLLFPDAPDEQFADAYAQTVAFALLLGRSEGADPLTLENAEASLAVQHNLLSRALQVLTDPSARAEMAASLDLLLRVIAAVPPASFRSGTGFQPVNHGLEGHATSIDPWLYFYEDFLAAYDPTLRKDAGAYYTPVEVVRCQVRLIDNLLINRLNKPLGFADPGVVTLDPAAGTGTYLLGVIEHALGRIEAEQGKGAVAGQATELAKNLYGFELMVGPYAVTELRVSRALRDRGAQLPQDGTHVYLTDTLESPNAVPPQLPLFLRPIAEQHSKALRVKSNVPVIVCLGNPPYDRHEAATDENKARTGGWVRWGDTEKGTDAIFRNFLDPATSAGHGVRVHNLYNLYVYFWRWALWKVFEQSSTGVSPVNHGRDGHATSGPGVVSFISASSYLDGDAFCGMREHLRRLCDEIWILDLGGEGRGTRISDNVFAIQTPVAIAIAVRGGVNGGGRGFQPVNHGQDGRATSINIRQGAYLPHWTKDHAIYSVSFRLGDSLPKRIVEDWIAERDNIIQTAKQMNRPPSVYEEKRLQYLFSKKVDKYLDDGHGKCWMKQEKIAGIVADALKHFNGERYRLLAWCIMPNHVHVVVQPLPGNELADILHSWKSFTANQSNKVLKRKGEFWQPEYYDHMIRDENDLAHSIEYVLRNPDKAGLTGWKWTGGGLACQPVNHGQDGRTTSRPAKVHYARIEGERDAKLADLDAINDFRKVKWQVCPEEWQAPFRPAGKGGYYEWPLLTDLMPWQQSGVKAGRTWVISPEEETLKKCWRVLLTAEEDEQKTLFKDSPTGRKVHEAATQLPPSEAKLKPISELSKGCQPTSIARYAYRSFDRQFIFADARLLDRPGPGLWRAHGERQVYLTSLFSQALGCGPALTSSAIIPDLDHFRGSYGAKAAIPLYRIADASEANILPGLLELLSEAFKGKWHGHPGRDPRAGSPCHLTAEDFLAYVYGALAQPAFTARFAKELETRELRVPITKDAGLFERIRDAGARLLWLHTYGERFVPKGKKRGQVPRGAAKCVKAVPGKSSGYPESFQYNDTTRTLHVGEGEFAPVAREVFEFEVSGLKVVQSWLKYRMKRGAGKKSSPLDDIRPERWTGQFTTELLELLWVLEATIEGYPAQEKLLEAVICGPSFQANELPAVPDEMRKPPAARKPGGDLFDGIEEE